MQSWGIVFVAVAVGLATGCLLGTQPSANGQLGRNLEHPLQASMISFASGAVIVLVLSLVAGVFPPRLVTPAGQLPWWIWTGGAIGVVMVTTSLIFVPRVGSLIWFAAVMTGQTGAAILLDHYGWMGNPRSPASPLRLLGAVLLIGGVLAIVEAKRTERPRQPAALDRTGKSDERTGKTPDGSTPEIPEDRSPEDRSRADHGTAGEPAEDAEKGNNSG